MKRQVLVVNLIDWSRSFVDDNGSFYCGTTHEQKENAGRVIEHADLVVFSSDAHPVSSGEFAINGGLYPAHNVVLRSEVGPNFEYYATPAGERVKLGDRTMTPALTEDIGRHLTGRARGMIVPKEIYYQDGASEPRFSPEDVERSFGTDIVDERGFIEGAYDYIVAPKHTFDATRLESDYNLPRKVGGEIPATNFNVFSLLRRRYPPDSHELVFVNTGVVEGICRLHTSIGLRQMFKSSRVVNLTDATTPLAGIGLGFDTPEQSRDAAMRVCKDVGVEYVTTDEFLHWFNRDGMRRRSSG
ncbi:MAG: hypothetical protein MUE55_07410 [Thermoplasmata archaeon]|nr:hypothetical protein [Thermoplasmata archaeon]